MMNLRANIKSLRRLLIERVDPDQGLLDLFTDAEVSRIRELRISVDKSEKILDYILKKKLYSEFIEALNKSKQTHIANFILGNGEYKDEYGDDWPVPYQDVKALEANRAKLVHLMETKGVLLLNRLVSKNVLNMKQKESIDSKSTSLRKVDLLLEILKRCSTSSFNEYKITIGSLQVRIESHDAELQVDPFFGITSSCVGDFNNFSIGAFEGLEESNPSHNAGVAEEVEDKCESPPLKRKKKEKKVIVVGSGGGWMVTNEVFELNLHPPNEISKLQPVPTEMQPWSVAVSFDEQLFVIGIGEDSDEIWKFKRISGWKECASLDKGRQGHCATIVNTLIYICGGLVQFYDEFLSSVEAYDLQTNKCSTVGELVHAVASSASVAYKGFIYIFGGDFMDCTETDCVQIYKTRDNTCSLLSKPMPSPQLNLRALSWNNSVILLNEWTCFIFDFETEIWEEREQFKTDVYHFGLGHDEEKVYVFGGSETDDDECTDEIKRVPLDDIINGTMVEWKLHGHLPEPTEIHAYA